MSNHKVIPYKSKERAEAEAYSAELKEHYERSLLKCIETIDTALRKTGEDTQALSFLFISLGMMLNNGSLKNLLNVNLKRKGGASE